MTSASYKTYLCCLLLSSCNLLLADHYSQVDLLPHKSAVIFDVNQIVAENAFLYRKIIEITDDQQYRVQNFYKQTNLKQSDIFVIKDVNNLSTFQELQTYNLHNLIFDGPLTLWFGNGNKSMSFNIRQGNAEGPFNTYYMISGNKEIEGYYCAGKPDGLWKYWTAEGKLDKQVYFQRGIIQWQKESYQIQGL